ncbi:MAG: glycosyltransferase family 2 protein [Nodularia sp. (in: Bacteria)]|nr:MAG: glycosyltransferase family 2 protein [Nodularia sp. (in: cyanobacteria)]
MLVFIIPLKNSKTSKSWDLTCKLFERCIKSVCNQTSANFRVVVVCSEIPQIEFHHPSINYVEVDFPLPTSEYKSKELDKGKRLLTGLAYAERFAPSHIMIVDADDCVSSHLAEFVSQNQHCNGWFVNKGYVYRKNSQLIYFRAKAFSQLCGSGVIVKYDHKFDYLFKNAIYDHKVKCLKDGSLLEPLPFIGGIYIIGNGENIYLNLDKVKFLKETLKQKGLLFYLRDFLQYRWLTKSIRNNFGLYKMN